MTQPAAAPCFAPPTATQFRWKGGVLTPPKRRASRMPPLAPFHLREVFREGPSQPANSNSETVSSSTRVKPLRISDIRISNSEPSDCRAEFALANHHSLLTTHKPLIGAPETLRVLGRLIDTPERLETRVSRRKQTVAAPSNRYSCASAQLHRRAFAKLS